MRTNVLSSFFWQVRSKQDVQKELDKLRAQSRILRDNSSSEIVVAGNVSACSYEMDRLVCRLMGEQDSLVVVSWMITLMLKHL